MQTIEYRIAATLDGWKIGFRPEGEPLLIHSKPYLTSLAALQVALTLASDEMRHGHHVRVLMDGEPEALYEAMPKDGPAQA